MWDGMDLQEQSSSLHSIDLGIELLQERISSLRGSKFPLVRVPSQALGESCSQWHEEHQAHIPFFSNQFQSRF